MSIVIARDLRSMFGPPRDQGDRPTCLAFATSDSHAALRDGWVPLSCEFVFYHAQRRAGRSPDQGATLGFMLEALREDGQPAEVDWPYNGSTPADPDTWAPPRGIREVYRRGGETCTSSGFDEIIASLDKGSPALVLMMLSDAFYAPSPEGIVAAKSGEGPDPALRHAVVAVAHGSVDGEAAVLIRNSWGHEWGMGGYAWLPISYLAPRLMCVAVLTENIDVLTNRTAA